MVFVKRYSRWFNFVFGICKKRFSRWFNFVFGICKKRFSRWFNLVFGICKKDFHDGLTLYLVFVKRFSRWFNFANRQLLLPRFVSRPGHVTGWWGQVCTRDKKKCKKKCKNLPFFSFLFFWGQVCTWDTKICKIFPSFSFYFPLPRSLHKRRKNKLKMKLHSFALHCLYL